MTTTDINSMLAPFHFRWRIQMRWSDMDELQHVNNAVYLTYFEEARLRYLHEMLQIPYRDVDTRMIVARNEIDYVRPLLFSHEPYLYMRCSRLGNKSFEIEQVIVNEQAGKQELIVQGKTVMVAYNYTTSTAVSVPEDWRERFYAYEPLLKK